MSALLECDLRGGGSILVEVEDSGGPVMRGGGSSGSIVTKAGETLEDLLGRVGPAVSGIVEELRSGASWPGDVEVEFAIRLSAESGVIIARTGGEANFRVSMRWNRASG